MRSKRVRISKFTNRNGSIAWRVSGTVKGERIRKNFKSRADAMQARELYEIQGSNEAAKTRHVATTLTLAQLREAERVFRRMLKGQNKSLTFAVQHFLDTRRDPMVEKSLLDAIEEYLRIKEMEVPQIISRRQYVSNRRELHQLNREFPEKLLVLATSDNLKTYLDAPNQTLKSWKNRKDFLSTFFKFCMAKGWIKTNPVEQVPNLQIKRCRGSEETLKAERHLSMEKLMDDNLRLKEANSHRSHFISSMNHELRTPLSALLGYADLYKKKYAQSANENQNAYIDNIIIAGKHLLNLINGLIDLAKIDAEKIEIEMDVFPPRDFVEEVLGMMAAKFQEKNLQLETFIDPGLIEITADRKKLMQIMLNLLSNAFKFTPICGRLDIRILRHTDGDIRVEVSDTGIGIKTEEIEKIFSEFYQIGRVSLDPAEGTGIGLALTRRLVELQGGKIGVISQPNVGSTFWFTLPHIIIANRLPKEDVFEKNINSTIPTGCRILLVEDSLIIRTMLHDMLSQYDHQITVAENGQEAVELAEKVRPDLIFMDIIMPIMNGLEATRRIRANKDIARVPIVALTADTGINSKEQQKDAGCTDHLAKPFLPEEMDEILKRYLISPQ